MYDDVVDKTTKRMKEEQSVAVQIEELQQCGRADLITLYTVSTLVH